MANAPFSNPSGGTWPLGFITVATAGTPVAINTNVGPQGQGAAYPTQFAKRVRQLIVTPKSTNTKWVYLVWNGYDHTTNQNGVLLGVPQGTIGSIPAGALLQSALISIDNLSLDADVSGEGAFITAIYG